MRRSGRERADAARNRRAILAATEDVLSRNRPEQVTMEQVARAAGVGKGTVFHRFGSRAGLMVALMYERALTMNEALVAGDPPLGPGAPPTERILAFLDAAVDLVRRNKGLVAALNQTVPCTSTTARRAAVLVTGFGPEPGDLEPPGPAPAGPNQLGPGPSGPSGPARSDPALPDRPGKTPAETAAVETAAVEEVVEEVGGVGETAGPDESHPVYAVWHAHLSGLIGEARPDLDAPMIAHLLLAALHSEPILAVLEGNGGDRVAAAVRSLALPLLAPPSAERPPGR
jgi:AcrR family transcriptional regulator